MPAQAIRSCLGCAADLSTASEAREGREVCGHYRQ